MQRGGLFLSVTGVTASAKGSPLVDISHYTVTCTGISAKATFSPPLTLNGLPNGGTGTETTTIKGTASGCTTSGPNGAVAVTKVSIKGSIKDTSSTEGCAGLNGSTPDTGTLTSTFKTNPKATPTSSAATVSSVVGGSGANGHGTFQLQFSGVTGAFTGTDGGASSTSDAQTTDTTAQIITACQGKKGLKSIAVEADANSGHGPALHVG